MNRRKIILIGLVYALAIAAFLAAIVTMAGLWPGAKAARPTAQRAAIRPPLVDAGIPTIRPISPVDGTTGVRGTRTPTPAPTRPAPGSTDTGAQPIAPGATTAAPGQPVQGANTRTPETPGPEPAASTATATLPPETRQPAAAPSATSLPPSSTPQPTNTASSVPPTATPTPLASGSIIGQVQVDKATPSRPLTVTLETTGYMVIASTRTAADGTYIFSHVPDLPNGYNVVFSQDANPDLQSELERFATWAWLGPVQVNGNDVHVPAFDIVLATGDQQPWKPISPASDALIQPGEMVQFEWPGFAQGSQYWLDITRGPNLDVVWQSPLQPQTTASWDGLDAGKQRQPGEYWWAIGARWNVLSSYTFTIYSHFYRFVLAS